MTSARERLAKLKELSQQRIQQIQGTSDAATHAAPQLQVLKPIAEQCARTSRSHTDLSSEKPAAVAETHERPVTTKPRSQSSISERRPPQGPARKEALATAMGAAAQLPPTGKQKEYVIKSKRYRVFGKVFQALDDENETVAIKRVNMKGLDHRVRAAYEQGVQLLSNLQGSPFVIKLYAYEQKDDYLFMVLEKGEKDLNKFLVEEYKSIDAEFIKYYWQEPSWKKAIYKVTEQLDEQIHEYFKEANFMETLERQ